MVEQTKSNFKLNGKLIIEKSTVKDLGWMKQLFFQVKTREDNLVPLNIDVRKSSKSNLNVKTDKDDKDVTKIPLYDGVDFLKNNFNNNDFAFIAGHVEYDSYRKALVLSPTTVYKASDKDFKSDDFEEVNIVQQEIVFDSVTGNKLKGNIITYFGEIIEVELDVEDDVIKQELQKLKFGDLITLNWERLKTPIYSKDGATSGKTIGKSYSSPQQSKYPKVEGYEEKFLVVGLEPDKTIKSKYDRKTLRDAQEEYERKQTEFKNNQPVNTQSQQEEDSDDLPY